MGVFIFEIFISTKSDKKWEQKNEIKTRMEKGTSDQ
jgi:hypothetical protein